MLMLKTLSACLLFTMQVTAHKHSLQCGDGQLKSDLVQNKHMSATHGDKHAFNTRANSPAVSAGAVGVGESAEVDVGGMDPEGTTSDVSVTACAKSIVTQ